MATEVAADTADTVAAPGAGDAGTPERVLSFWDRFFFWLPAAHRRSVGIIIITAFALAFPLLHDNDADIDSAANALAYATLALGLNIVVGMAGLLDLGYAAFFAIGAYAYGILTSFQVEPAWSGFWQPFATLGLVEHVQQPGVDVVHFTVSFWIMMPVSALIAALFGVLFGAPTLRLRGDYLAIVTLGFGEIVPIVVRNWSSLTNGAAGLNGIQAPMLFGKSFGVSATPYYYVAVGARGAARSSSAYGSVIRASVAPGWRSARTRSRPAPWASISPASSCSPSPSARPSPARPAPSTWPSCRPRHRRCSAIRSP